MVHCTCVYIEGSQGKQMKINCALANGADLIKKAACMMLHFLMVFTVSQKTLLGACSIKMVIGKLKVAPDLWARVQKVTFY